MICDHYVLFETAFGTCAMAYGALGIVRVRLPESTHDELVARFDRYANRAQGEWPAEVLAAVDAVTAHLRGELQDLAAIPVSVEEAPSQSELSLEARGPPAQSSLL